MENEFNQGGLGAGVTKSQKNGAYAFVPTGITHEFGNGIATRTMVGTILYMFLDIEV